MAGRPSKYNDTIAAELLKEYSGGKTLVSICNANRMPSRWSIYRWRAANPEFDKEFLKACECHADAIIEKAFDGVMTGDKSESKLLDVQFKASSWLASKVNRAKYGDKLELNHNVTLDISQAMTLALTRMKSIGTGSAPLLEADITPK
jgi:hypothetical protein